MESSRFGALFQALLGRLEAGKHAFFAFIFSRLHSAPLAEVLKMLSSTRFTIDYSLSEGSCTLHSEGEGSVVFADDKDEKESLLMYLVDTTRKVKVSWIFSLIEELDAYLSLAQAAKKFGYVKPEITEEGELKIVNGWHPVLQFILDHRRKSGAGAPEAVRNKVVISPQQNVLVVTGPNAGGKSTLLRQLGLTSLMAQMGSYVPAEAARVPIFDGIFTHFTQEDDLRAGRSTFQAELGTFRETLGQITRRSLLICDEFFRGTDPAGGGDLFCGIVSGLPQRAAAALISTHFRDALRKLEGRAPGLQVVQVTGEFKEGKFRPTYQVAPGISGLDYTVDFAAACGLPGEMIRAAEGFRRS